MNSSPSSNQSSTPSDSHPVSNLPLDLDDDLDAEELGERPQEVCTFEEGCLSCQ